MIRVFIPSFQQVHREPEGRGYTLRKTINTPEFPPKKVRNWSYKIIEQRRQSIEAYLQAVVKSNVLPKSLLSFLEIGDIRFDDSCGSYESLDCIGRDSCSHQPVLAFAEDAYLEDKPLTGMLPDLVSEGVFMGFYGTCSKEMDALVGLSS
ncbi:PREDICTED: sorting nexin-24-like isoform X2 [Priapulus caudatus]|uniref:Sorting nexin-24-like isoform X2 n=1 Tax=Priapulus caudatus TaxID=37621 RepID=A0ABM1DS41_PRICU|nr:PREDICTED: sorting nexin-24-like isoform X2 [Priapulus caudatus]